MSRTKIKYDVTGLTIKDIASYTSKDIMSMNTDQLRKTTTRLISAMNKTLRRAKPTKTGVWSPMVQQLARQQGIDLDTGDRPQFHIAKPDLPKNASKLQKANAEKGALQHQLRRLQQIYNSKTFTHSGFMKSRKEIEKSLSFDITGSKVKENAFWKAYNDFMFGKDETRNLKEIFKSSGQYNVVLTYAQAYVNTHPNFNSNTLYNALMREYNNKAVNVDDQFKNYKFRGKTISLDEMDEE